MTENLLQKVEDKIHLLIAEVATMRQELLFLKHENASLRKEQGGHAQKLQHLISLLNVLGTEETVSL